MLKYFKCHYIQIKLIDLIFKIIWESFFSLRWTEEGVDESLPSLAESFMWNGNSFLSNCLF